MAQVTGSKAPAGVSSSIVDSSSDVGFLHSTMLDGEFPSLDGSSQSKRKMTECDEAIQIGTLFSLIRNKSFSFINLGLLKVRRQSLYQNLSMVKGFKLWMIA